VNSVPWIAVAEVVLDEAHVVALVGEVVPAGVPKGVRVHVRQLGSGGGG